MLSSNWEDMSIDARLLKYNIHGSFDSTMLRRKLCKVSEAELHRFALKTCDIGEKFQTFNICMSRFDRPYQVVYRCVIQQVVVYWFIIEARSSILAVIEF